MEKCGWVEETMHLRLCFVSCDVWVLLKGLENGKGVCVCVVCVCVVCVCVCGVGVGGEVRDTAWDQLPGSGQGRVKRCGNNGVPSYIQYTALHPPSL